MSAFLDGLMKQRRKFLDGLTANQDDINLDIFEDFYPDEAHFVFELLQNAEDTGATEATFTLAAEGCWFSHNGKRAFNEDDVRAITGIHNSTKAKAPDQIGKFGVGFKSVFVYTQTPAVYAADFSFRIIKYVMPEPIDADPALGGRTKFWLPFNNPKKPAPEAYAEIAAGLNQLAENTLLFLPSIESIKWRIGSATEGEILRIEHSPTHIEVLKEVNGEKTTSAHFLRFDQPVKDVEKQRVAVAFALDFLPNVQSFSAGKPLSKQVKIVPAHGSVSVFFPAPKETSGLRFHLHAPFVPELSRASIKSTPANYPLFDQLAALSCAALLQIRDLGLLTPEFLGVLPNPQDELGEGYGYDRIRDSIQAAMKDERLFPTHRKDHAPARILVQARAALKDLITDADIEFLIDYDDEPPRWAASRALQGTNAERFMTGLGIREWDIGAFVESLAHRTGGSYRSADAEFMKWMAAKSADWHQQLYALLDRENAVRSNHYLGRAPLVRLAGGRYAAGSMCHFPDERSVKVAGLNCVDPAILSAGKSKGQQEAARAFLEAIGVTEAGERNLVEVLLESRYAGSKRLPVREKQYASDLRRFFKLLADDPSAKDLLAGYALFMGADDQWHEASEIYLDSPYRDTGLREAARISGVVGQVGLAELYQSLPIDTGKVADFAAKLGAATVLTIRQTHCFENPQWYHLRTAPGQRSGDSINRDYVIAGLGALAEQKSLTLAKLIWLTMMSSHGVLNAIYQITSRGGPRYADSQLVHDLRKYTWIPQRGGGFVRPADARAELLPDGFTYDAGWQWIREIEFGKNIHLEKQKAQAEAEAAVEQRRKHQEAAKALGFSDTEIARKLAAIPVDQQSRMVAEWERQTKLELPEKEPRNPERRTERVKAHAQTALERRTELRSRSVSVNREEVKDEAKQYLRQQYTNADAEQICQICKDVLPFRRLDDGSFYFECVELLPDLRRHYDQNYLCLCPNHAAMFRHANPSRPDLRKALRKQTENKLSVTLARRQEVLYFTKMHLADLRDIIEVDEAEAGAAAGTASASR